MSAPFMPLGLNAQGLPEAELDRAPWAERGTATGFVAGIRIATPMGYVAVERLAAGDLVLTADGRHARLVWVGTTRVEGGGGAAPVRFETGTLGNMRPLRVGQGQRLRVSGLRAELLFDARIVMGAARGFVNGEDVVIERPTTPVSYVHLMFDRPEIVLAENVPCEAMRPGPDGLARIEAMLRIGGSGPAGGDPFGAAPAP